MNPNNFPIYSRVGDIQWVSGYMTAANTTADLTSGTIYLVFTADATNGGWLESIDHTATPGGNTTLTVARYWLNNGNTTGTAANNVLIGEMTLPAQTASSTAETTGFTKEIRRAIPPGYRVYITLGTASANGWNAVANGGKY